MNSPSQNRSLLATPSDDFDTERLEWPQASRWSTWPRKLRFPRLRKMAVALFLIDLMIVAFLVHSFDPLITLLRKNEELFGARLTLPVNGSSSSVPSSEVHAIPRILHQTSATTTIPDKWVDLQKSCKEAYSEFEYKHWTDENAREFIASKYSWFLDTWDNYAFPIQRADAIRYFILYHFGGIYLDMDTLCNKTIPFDQIEADGAEHHAVFKSTTPTGVSNDLMISSPRHPAFKTVLSKIVFFNDITRSWAQLLPHATIMVASGPFFLTMALKNYLLSLPSLPTPAVQVINATELLPYITDLEASSWHHGDTQALMWIGERPWIWFGLGAIGLAIGLHIINKGLMLAFKGFDKAADAADEMKVAKLT